LNNGFAQITCKENKILQEVKGLKSLNPLTAEIAKVKRKVRKELINITLALRTLRFERPF